VFIVRPNLDSFDPFNFFYSYLLENNFLVPMKNAAGSIAETASVCMLARLSFLE